MEDKNNLCHFVFSSELNFLYRAMICVSFIQGAVTTCYVVLNPKVKGVTRNDYRQEKGSKMAESKALGEQLCEFREGLIRSAR
jgi:hypothetical protein